MLFLICWAGIAFNITIHSFALIYDLKLFKDTKVDKNYSFTVSFNQSLITAAVTTTAITALFPMQNPQLISIIQLSTVVATYEINKNQHTCIQTNEY